MRKAIFRTILILSFLVCVVSAALPMWQAQSAEGSTIYLSAVNFILGGWHIDDILADYGCIMSANDIRFAIVYLIPLLGLICANFLNPGKKRYYVISFITAILSGLGFILTDRLFCYADMTSAERMIQTTYFIYPCLAAYVLIPAVSVLGFILYYFFPDKKKDDKKALPQNKDDTVKMLPDESKAEEKGSADDTDKNSKKEEETGKDTPKQAQSEENKEENVSPDRDNTAPVTKFCPECGNKVRPGDKFCPECGKSLR